MHKIDYNKDYMAIAQQILGMQQKGMIFNSEAYASEILQYIAYYRLSGYLHHFYTDETKSTFIGNLYFDNIIKLYGFDKKLRLLILDAVETIEIALRSIIIADISKNNTFAFDDDSIFNLDSKNLKSFHDSRQTCWNRSKEVFVKHFNEKYTKSPVWVEVETWSLGTIRDYLTSVKAGHLNFVSKKMGTIDNKRLVNWIRCFAHIRNISAHHSRLWNKNLMSINVSNCAFDFHGHMEYCKECINTYNTENKTHIDINRKIYAYCVALWHVLRIIHPHSTWNTRLKSLIKDYFPDHMPYVSLENMGFPNNWDTESFWGLR